MTVVTLKCDGPNQCSPKGKEVVLERFGEGGQEEVLFPPSRGSWANSIAEADRLV